MTLTEPARPGPFEPSFASLTAFSCPDWFRDAKLGIWSHWGAQSVPRQGDWYARNMYIEGSPQYRHHLRTYGHPSRSGYRDIVARWKAERFDPEALMDLYVRAGAHYFVAQAVHHDHFLNYASTLHRWNAAAMGPRQDIVGRWQAAARRHGLPFGLTEHLGATFSWWAVNKGADRHGPYAGIPYDGNDPEYADLYLDNQEHVDPVADERPPRPWYTPNPAWHRHWQDLVTEMIDRYQPDLLYSDGELPFGEHGYQPGLDVVAHLYNSSAARHDGVNQAVYNQKGRDPQLRAIGVFDIERSQEPDIADDVWQTDTCLGEWFYNDRAVYKTPRHAIDLLIDIVAKNGNLLLNVPQLPDGTIDEECRYLLEELAGWTAVCGEGIFGTRPYRVAGEGPSRVAIEGFREDAVAWSDADYRFTRRDNVVYAFQLAWPKDRRAVIRTLTPQERVRSVRLLGGDQLPFQQADGVLVVSLPDKPATPYANALAIEI